ncbi:MAG: hypothetical protein RIT04_554 [Candidatus Parcubacteria bacterium]|jgi:hypothetical protein
MNVNELKINLGSVSFWIKENQIQFNDSKATPIFAINPEGGSIFMIKDEDNKIKVFYVVIGKGRVDLEVDVSSLNSTEKHMVAYTWDLFEGKKLTLYIDGKEVATKGIPF